MLDKRGSTSGILEIDDENEEGLANSGIASPDLEELRTRVRGTRPANTGRVKASESMDHIDNVAY